MNSFLTNSIWLITYWYITYSQIKANWAKIIPCIFLLALPNQWVYICAFWIYRYVKSICRSNLSTVNGKVTQHEIVSLCRYNWRSHDMILFHILSYPERSRMYDIGDHPFYSEIMYNSLRPHKLFITNEKLFLDL